MRRTGLRIYSGEQLLTPSEEARTVKALVDFSEQIVGMNLKSGPKERNRLHSLGGRGVDYDATGVGRD